MFKEFLNIESFYIKSKRNLVNPSRDGGILYMSLKLNFKLPNAKCHPELIL